MTDLVAWLFGMGLFANGAFLAWQGWHIFRAKSSAGVSIVTFCGFAVLQLIGILHGHLQDDSFLVVGMIASLVGTSFTVFLALWYRERGTA